MITDTHSLREGRLTAEAARHLAVAVWRRFHEGRCAQVAGSLTFTSLLSLVPFVTLVVLTFSRFPQSTQFSEALKGFLLDNLLPDKAGKVIAAYAVQFSQKSTNLTIVGGVVLVVTALSLIKTIDQAINQIWNVRGTRRWATRFAVYWAALSVGPVFLAGCVFASSAVLSLSLDLVGEPVWLGAVALRLMPVALLTGLFAAVYYIVPHCTVRPVDALAAGFLAALLLVSMQRLFGLYLTHFTSYTLVYGAFAVVPIFLMWLYLSWIVILLGAVVAAVLPERTLLGRMLPAFPGRSLYLALLVLGQLVRAQRRGLTPDVGHLARTARAGHDEVRAVLESCQRARIVVRSDEGGWLLARAADAVSLAEVAQLFAWDGVPRKDAVATPLEAQIRPLWETWVARLNVASELPLSVLAEAGDEKDQSG
ncbi:MAG TPA: YihY family inner membrane protein [Rhodocyclaceae bacterium]|uniref:YihY family inner membrane protein n=1 Tax=Zoogloea sp. TaxID=49181 RepID=UPI002C6042F3|nr:YihY family inner membrane protein [Zoogloea sp.]HMW52870.1 YihY family inner membrane protein [Rhodocyclaceae bacterium]HMY48292.1 YihY family inner membrane protein [Rhodocyclaceae bacterium]HNA66387.1 YihY family inner membrane protein [Rhodocyclaceae bacterium]HNH15090.1 YihY family inner membrane protein [Zoogloea sp.]HNO86974.1 YihY family inner membrane protein [Rhodocyclaceae bacterium]